MPHAKISPLRAATVWEAAHVGMLRELIARRCQRRFCHAHRIHSRPSNSAKVETVWSGP